MGPISKEKSLSQLLCVKTTINTSLKDKSKEDIKTAPLDCHLKYFPILLDHDLRKGVTFHQYEDDTT